MIILDNIELDTTARVSYEPDHLASFDVNLDVYYESDHTSYRGNSHQEFRYTEREESRFLNFDIDSESGAIRRIESPNLLAHCRRYAMTAQCNKIEFGIPLVKFSDNQPNLTCGSTKIFGSITNPFIEVFENGIIFNSGVESPTAYGVLACDGLIFYFSSEDVLLKVGFACSDLSTLNRSWMRINE